MRRLGTTGAVVLALLLCAAAIAGGAQASPEAELDLAAATEPDPGSDQGNSGQQDDPPGDQGGGNDNQGGGNDNQGGGSDNQGGGNDNEPGGGGGGGGSENEPPGCNGTIHLSSSGSSVQGTDPKYTRGETVWAHGTGFDANETFTHSNVEDVNDHVMVKESDTDWSADGSGDFVLEAIATGGLVDAHEYKVTVFWNETLPNGDTKTCHKSKNFFLVAAEEQGGGGGGSGGGGGGSGGGGEQTPPAEQPSGGQPAAPTAPPTTQPTTPPTTPPTTAAPPAPETTGGSAPTAPPTPEAGGVAGVEETETSAGFAGGVAGAFAESAQAELPFTGFPAWAVAVASLFLAATGFALRRVSDHGESD